MRSIAHIGIEITKKSRGNLVEISRKSRGNLVEISKKNNFFSYGSPQKSPNTSKNSINGIGAKFGFKPAECLNNCIKIKKIKKS